MKIIKYLFFGYSALAFLSFDTLASPITTSDQTTELPVTTEIPVTSPYQWCNVSELNPEKGYYAAEFTILNEYDNDSESPRFFQTTIARRTTLRPDSDTRGWYFQNSSPGEILGYVPVWCAYSSTRNNDNNANGCNLQEDQLRQPTYGNSGIQQEFEVLCNTPGQEHRYEVPETSEVLPAYRPGPRDLISDEGEPNRLLCRYIYEEKEIIGVIPRNNPNPENPHVYDQICKPVALSYRDAIGDSRLLTGIPSPNTFIVLRKAESVTNKHPLCASPPISGWNPTHFRPFRGSDENNVYYCQTFVPETGDKRVGIEEITDGQLNCKLTVTEDGGYRRIPFQASESSDSEAVYERIGLFKDSGWVSYNAYSSDYRAGCLSLDKLIRGFNFCRFEKSGNMLYGIVADRGNRASVCEVPYLTQCETDLAASEIDSENCSYTHRSELFDIYTNADTPLLTTTEAQTTVPATTLSPTLPSALNSGVVTIHSFLPVTLVTMLSIIFMVSI